MEKYRALKDALASGTREVWYGDKRIAYRDYAEMKAILRDMEDELGISQGNSPIYPAYYDGIKPKSDDYNR